MFHKYIKDENLYDTVKQESEITHVNKDSVESSYATNLLCRFLIKGDSWETSLEKVRSDPHITSQLVKTALELKLPFDSQGHAPKVLAAALHYLNSSTSFHSALKESIKFAGPANYCPVLVGSIGGARWGFSSIDPSNFKFIESNLFNKLLQAADEAVRVNEK